jgi:hypothetical protein
MPKRRILDLVDSHHRIPRQLYQKITAIKEQTKSRSNNKTLCLCLQEYFELKEDQKKENV